LGVFFVVVAVQSCQPTVLPLVDVSQSARAPLTARLSTGAARGAQRCRFPSWNVRPVSRCQMKTRSQSSFVRAAANATSFPSAASAVTVLRLTICADCLASALATVRHAERTARKITARLTRKD
jgi:hypothetical protein